MDLKTLGEELQKIYPTAYWSFPEKQAPSMPYIVYFQTPSENMAADNKVYFPRNTVAVELYTRYKDTTAEAALEAFFDKNDIFWQKSETHLDDENAYEVIYEIEVY